MQIFLRSQHATTVAEGVYTWLFPTPVRFGNPGDRVEVVLSLFQFIPIRRNIPIEYYITIDTRPGLPIMTGETGSWTITIPAGNYDAMTFAALINEGAKNLTDEVSFTFDPTAMGFVLRKTTGFPLILGLQADFPLLRIMGISPPPPPDGFAWNPWDGTPTVYGDGVIRSDMLVNFAGPTYLTVETSLQSTNVADESLNSSILAKVPIQTGYADLQTWQDVTSFSTIADHEITSLAVQFKDSFGDVVDFQGIPWNATLLFRVTPSGVYQPLESNYSNDQEQTTKDGD